MIISKTPLRIPIAGGGTDLPSFYSRFGSYFISAAIDKYVYIVLQERKYYKEFLLKYSRTEKVVNIDKIKNNIIRESLKLLKIHTPLEIVSFSDVGGETGLGSSGAFCVGLLNALHNFKRELVTQEQLAEEACHIAIDVLGQPSGKQDEYIAAFGGVSSFRVNKKGKVIVNKDEFQENFIRELEHFLYMFYTGIHRKSKDILQKQKDSTINNDKDIINNLKNTQELGYEIRDALKNGNAAKFGELLHKHWEIKRQRSKTTNEKIDRWYEIARKNGVVGGKIMGAGGGGFFLFYCEKNAPKMIEVLERSRLKHVPFNFDYSGSKIIVDLQ
jgi:D-glycero-alpha-D-manno-heptose-7-phosphate kinase